MSASERPSRAHKEPSRFGEEATEAEFAKAAHRCPPPESGKTNAGAKRKARPSMHSSDEDLEPTEKHTREVIEVDEEEEGDGDEAGFAQESGHESAGGVEASDNEDVSGTEEGRTSPNRKERRAAVKKVKRALSGRRPGNNHPSHKKAPEGQQGAKEGPSKHAPLPDSDARDVDGLLADLSSIKDIGDGDKPRQLKKMADIDEFFDNRRNRNASKPDLKVSIVMDCKKCKKDRKSDCDKKADPTTLRRHMEALHPALYRGWCRESGFVSMLPGDSKARQQAKDALAQSSLDAHTVKIEPKPEAERVTNEVWAEAAWEWLISTDQALSAFQNKKFQRMIDLASHAKPGEIKIPDARATRQYLIDKFTDHLRDLRKRLKSTEIGDVSLTCDAWQASNTDAYFAVTAHWIEVVNDVAVNQAALIGFTRLNYAHHGVRLGQALFKIAQRVGIISKIGWVTCDNASNNDTMMVEFARLVSKSTGETYDAVRRRIRCLAHTINLAAQAVIKAISSSRHFSPGDPATHEPDEATHDVVAIIRSVVVKVGSSSTRKELFSSIQTDALKLKSSKRLILDMPVRWSSTYFMLERAYELREAVDRFVLEITLTEKDAKKREKLQRLRLSDDDWTQVSLIIKILSHANDAQQAFSSDLYPTVAMGIPALEHLHEKWSKLADRSKYAAYKDAITAGLEKVAEYYAMTERSEAFIMCMVLDPIGKMQHFKDNWGPSLTADVETLVKDVFKQRYIKLHGTSASVTQRRGGLLHLAKGIARLQVASDSDDSDDSSAATPSPAPATTPAWQSEYTAYMSGNHVLPEGMTLVQFWHSTRDILPTWASLARDYLAIMASSVSSERAFSSAALTITKRRNRLKADVVEALQSLKMAIKRDLLTRAQGPSKSVEEALLAEADAEQALADVLELPKGAKDTIQVSLDLESDCEEDDEPSLDAV